MRSSRLSCLALLATCACSALAQHAVDYTPGSGSMGLNYNQSVGWQFDVLSSVTVTHLAWQDEERDGLSTAHEVGIWNSAGTLLGSAVIAAGTGATLDGIWRVVDVPDFVLAAGTGYIVGGYNGSGTSDVLRYDVSGLVVDSRLSHVDAMFSAHNGIFERPTNFSSATTGFYGPSFNLAPVPEPFTMGLAGLALAAAARRRLRKSA